MARVAAPDEMLTSTPRPARDRTWRANAAEPCITPSTLMSTLAQGGGVGVGQRADRLEHAGVVDPQVDPAERSDHLGGEPVDRGGVGHVDRAGHDSVSGGAVGRVRAQRPSRRPSAANAAAMPGPARGWPR